MGAACAYHATRAGLSVCVIDRGPLADGTTSAGEGNLLVSDKEPGPELDLALLSNAVWHSMADVPVCGTTFGARAELDPKGGLVVASSAATLQGLEALARQQAAAGVESAPVSAAGLSDHEPNLAPGLAGGFIYPQDMQVQPMLATALLLRLARDGGAVVLLGETVTGFVRDGDRVTGVRTARRELAAGAVVNCAGTWAGDVAALAGVRAYRSLPGAGSCWSPSRCRAWYGTRCTSPTTWPTWPATPRRCRPRPWSRGRRPAPF